MRLIVYPIDAVASKVWVDAAMTKDGGSDLCCDIERDQITSNKAFLLKRLLALLDAAKCFGLAWIDIAPVANQVHDFVVAKERNDESALFRCLVAEVLDKLIELDCVIASIDNIALR